MPERALCRSSEKVTWDLAALGAHSSSRSTRKVFTPCICHTLVRLDMYVTRPITLIREADKSWALSILRDILPQAGCLETLAPQCPRACLSREFLVAAQSGVF